MATSLEQTAPPFRPWLTIWFKPRGTMRQILDYHPKYGIYLLAGLSGIYRFIERAGDLSLGDRFPLPWLLAFALLASIVGLILLYVFGSAVRWTGSLFGGQGKTVEICSALAWASIPDVILLGIYVLIIIAFGDAWFISDYDFSESIPTALTLLALIPVGVILLFFRIFLSIKCVAEAHRFSSWRSMAALILGTIIVTLAFLAIFGLPQSNISSRLPTGTFRFDSLVLW